MADIRCTRVHSDRLIRVRYRLLREPPFTISFPSAVFRLEWSRDPHNCLHTLVAWRIGGSGGPVFDSFHAQEDKPERMRAVYITGFAMPRPSIGDTVMTRATKDGRAELIAGPHMPVVFSVIYGLSR